MPAIKHSRGSDRKIIGSCICTWCPFLAAQPCGFAFFEAKILYKKFQTAVARSVLNRKTLFLVDEEKFALLTYFLSQHFPKVTAPLGKIEIFTLSWLSLQKKTSIHLINSFG